MCLRCSICCRYCRLADIVDQLFPPIKDDDFQSDEYSTFRYWREPLPDISFLDISEVAGVPGAAAAATVPAAGIVSAVDNGPIVSE
uniref:Uncharacterized protein n=1 Tax=Phlebotomus papatasi TaxID=29031 RepID=A0A1B0D9G8_PHLPP